MSKTKTIIVFPTIKALMTGVVYVTRGRRQATLHYTDGSTESASNKYLADVDWENPFSIVNAVQATRRA
jgi:hypothetical protein